MQDARGACASTDSLRFPHAASFSRSAVVKNLQLAVAAAAAMAADHVNDHQSQHSYVSSLIAERCVVMSSSASDAQLRDSFLRPSTVCWNAQSARMQCSSNASC